MPSHSSRSSEIVLNSFFIAILCITGIFFSGSSISAQCTNEGKEFYIVFASNYPNPSNNSTMFPNLSLFLSSRERSTTVEIMYGTNAVQNVTLNVGTVTVVSFPVNPCHLTANRNINSTAGIHLRSLDSTRFSVYGLNRLFQTTDGFTAIPVEGLGTRYRLASYTKSYDASDGNPEVAIIATRDTTTITLSIPGATPQVTTVTLDKRQSYLFQDPVDITGGLITSDKPIAVFSGNTCTMVPYMVDACDHLIEQLLPVPSWGNIFFTAPFAERNDGDVYRIIADKDSTVVFVNGVWNGIINAGKFLENEVLEPMEIYATRPVQVAQYAKSYDSDHRTGDPFMIVLPSEDLYLDGYNFTIPSGADAFHTNWLTIIAPQAYTGNVRLDSSPVTTTWKPIPKTFGAQAFATTNILLTSNTPHSVTYDPLPAGKDRFTLSGYIYGWDTYESYGNVASFGVKPQGDSSCLPTITLCAQTSTTSDKKPGELAWIPIEITLSGKVNDATTIDVVVHYPVDLLRLAGKPQTRYKGAEILSASPGEILMRIKVDTSLDISNIVVAELPMEILLAPRAEGELNIVSSVITLKGGEKITGAACPGRFSLDSGCILPSDLKLRSSATIESIYPNPSSSITKLVVNATNQPQVDIEISDIFGRHVESLYDGMLTNGKHEFTINQSGYATGVYFCRLQYGTKIIMQPFAVKR